MLDETEDTGATALVLSGGGARGAYQAGALRGLAELGFLSRPGQFPYIVGNSAGSINGATMAAWADRPQRGLDELLEVWSTMRADLVFRTDLPGLARIAWGWIRDLTFGGLLGRVSPKSLLDTAPLWRLLEKIPLERVERNVAEGYLRAFAVAATHYRTTNTVLFLQGVPGLPTWQRVHYRVEPARIGLEHLMASSAIPLFFPTVLLGNRHFGDGCIRNSAPLGPAIQLGARRVVAIGVREPWSLRDAAPEAPEAAPCPAAVVSVLLDAVMLDAIEVDVEHCVRVNGVVRARREGCSTAPFREVDVLWLGPSRSISDLALRRMHRIPYAVRYLLHGLGSGPAAAELASYLLFDGEFCRDLIEMGRQDVLARAEEVRAFFERARPSPPEPRGSAAPAG